MTVFGDNLNDMGMFVRAGRKIAVSIASSQLIAEADEVIMSDEEDGVATYISQLMEERNA